MTREKTLLEAAQATVNGDVIRGHRMALLKTGGRGQSNTFISFHDQSSVRGRCFSVLVWLGSFFSLVEAKVSLKDSFNVLFTKRFVG